MTPRHLLTFLSDDPDDLNLARRQLPYDRIFLLVTPHQHARAEAVAEAERRIAGPDAATVLSLPPGDMHGALTRLRTLLAGLGASRQVTLNIGGADPAHVSAAMVLAFDHGLHTVVCQHERVVALPILFGVKLQDRFDADERRVLGRLGPGGDLAEHLAQHLLIPKERIHRAGRGLRDKGVAETRVEGGSTRIALTRHGETLRGFLG